MARIRLNGNHLYITEYTNDEMDPLLNKKILPQYKANGFLIVKKLNSIIAGGIDGYFAPNNDDTIISIIDRCRGAVNYDDVVKVLKFAKEIGYYDKKLCDESRIFTSRDLQLMHFEASTNREETYILSEYSLLKKEDIKALNLVKSGKKIIKSLEKRRKIEISSSNNEITSLNNSETSLSNNETYLSYSHKEKKRKENNIKENENKKNEIKINENKLSENKGSKLIMHKALETFLQYNLIPNDPLTLDVLNQMLWQMNKDYGGNSVINASFIALSKMRANKQEISDYRQYLSDLLSSILENKQEDTAEVTVDDEARELERLKLERKNRKKNKESESSEEN